MEVDDSAWAMLSTAKHQTYIEIQGGPIGDQSIKLEMQPVKQDGMLNTGSLLTKKWIFEKLKTPSPVLRPLMKFNCLVGQEKKM